MKEEILGMDTLLHGASLELDQSNLDFLTARRIVDCHCELGEGVLFDDRRKAVLWTDILGKTFHKLQLDYERGAKIIFTTYDLPKKLCSFGMLETAPDGSKLPLLCAWEDGFQLYDVGLGKALSERSSGEDVNPHKGPTRLNDGRVEPQGKRYVCGGYYGEDSTVTMKVYKVEQMADGKLTHEPIEEGLRVTNSICWSLDGSTMYLADSPTKQIHRYTYDAATGTLSEKTLMHTKTTSTKCVPDGSCVDEEGFLWNAVWRGGEAPGMVQRIDPQSGHVVFTVHMPDATSQVTCCCFGGEDFDILFITTAAENRRDKEPHAGALYAVKVPFKGQPESRLCFTVPT